MPMGANFGDIDNDGFLDIYLGTGNPSYASLLPNVLLRNKEGKSFVDVTASSGTGELHKGHGIAFADLDNDGDEEIVAEIGGATPGDSHPLRLFENPGHGNDWINLRLVGVKTNRAAIGARIKVTVENEGRGTRSIYRSVGSGGSFGASPLEQHIGLGKSARIVDLEIWWPASNTRQHFAGLGKNQVRGNHRVGAELHARSNGRPITLGGSEGGLNDAFPRTRGAAAAGRFVLTSRLRPTGVSGDRHGAERRSRPQHLHRVDSGDPRLHAGDDHAVRGSSGERSRRSGTRRSRGVHAGRRPAARRTPNAFVFVRYQSVEQDPLTASRLKLLIEIAGRGRPSKPLAVGETVPDFRLTDQKRRPVALSAVAREGRRRQLHLHQLCVAEFLSAHRQQLRRPPETLQGAARAAILCC